MRFSGEFLLLRRRVMYVGILLLFSVVLAACGPFAVAQSNVPTLVPLPENNPIKVILDGVDITKNRLALIRVLGTTYMDDLDNNELSVRECLNGQIISIWVSGYFTKSIVCNGVSPWEYKVTLQQIDTSNSVYYSWTSAYNCASCHSGGSGRENYFEFTEWGLSNHAKTFSNHYFETMYRGSYLGGSGTSSITGRDVINDDMVLRAPPNPYDPNYHGPGYKLDNPNSNGNCAFCHAPVAVARERVEVDPFNVGGIVQEGVTCDTCHKVINIELNDSGYPYEANPGVLSFEYLLPPGSSNFYIGPLTGFPENPNAMTTCSTIFSKSEFCAACHYGKFYDTLIYGSYDEWKKSGYGADPSSETYQTCQDCHMSIDHKVITGSTSTQRQACSANNTSSNNFSHNLMNFDASQNTPLMVKNAATIQAGFIYNPAEKNWFTVTTKVASIGVGHRFPTDSPLRHLILVVEAKDQRDVTLVQVNGERIPNWGGVGNPTPNPGILNYGGLPGKIFANLLVEEDTNISPATAFWNETKYAWVGALSENPDDYSDTRLLPGKSDDSQYSFAVPEEGDVTVTIQLVYRFAFIDLMRQKGWWDRPDIVVTKVVCKGPPKEPLKMKCEEIKQ